MKLAHLPFLLMCLICTSAHAEKADRDKPVHLESDRITVDDAKKIHTLEGNVQLVQGTLVIRCEKLVVTQDAQGFQKGIATGGTGGLAHFRQKREGKDEYIDGEAERIVHDARTEKTEFFQRAYIKSGNDEVRGQYVSYDGNTENYLVTNGPNGTTTTTSGTGASNRVRVVIQPKPREAAAQSTPAKAAPAP